MSEVFNRPTDPNGFIWRYLDFDKYKDMLETQSLYFARADTLGEDDHECTVPMANTRLTEDAIKYLRWPPDRFEEKQTRSISDVNTLYVELTKQVKETCFVSCWHMNVAESVEMWKRYVPSPKMGVVIRSTTESLEKVTDNYRGAMKPGYPGVISIGTIKYIDYEEEPISYMSLLNFIMHKRTTYEVERELRAVYWGVNDLDDMCSKRGHKIKVDLNGLIERIFLMPGAEPAFQGMVTAEKKKWNVDAEVCPSVVLTRPSALP